VKPHRSYVQVGSNAAQRLVKIRVPDEKSADGFLLVALSPDEARVLADEVEERPLETPLLLSNGKRWAEHQLLPETRDKFVSDLRKCAIEAEGD